MNSTDFSTRLYLSSVQLNRLDDRRKPAAFASDCLIDYFGKRVLLTVAHATGIRSATPIVPGSMRREHR
jgi:hypothetical protein